MSVAKELETTRQNKKENSSMPVLSPALENVLEAADPTKVEFSKTHSLESEDEIVKGKLLIIKIISKV